VDVTLFAMATAGGCRYGNSGSLQGSESRHAFEAWRPDDQKFVGLCLLAGMATSAALVLALREALPRLLEKAEEICGEPMSADDLMNDVRLSPEVLRALEDSVSDVPGAQAMPEDGDDRLPGPRDPAAASLEPHERLRPVVRAALEDISLEFYEAQAVTDVRREWPHANEEVHDIFVPGRVRFAV
jgi:hypothetical protein